MPFREPVFAPDDDKQLKALVHAAPSIRRIIDLTEAQHEQLRAHAGHAGFFEGTAHALTVAAKSIGLAKEQRALLAKLVEQYGVEQVVQSIEREEALRRTVQKTMHSVTTLNEGAEKYRGQYTRALKALNAFGIDHKEAPTWDDIAARLTPEKLALIEKVEEAQLILVPPLSRQDLIQALNSKVGQYGMKHKAMSYGLEYDQLWNNGQPESLVWEAVFVDGRQDLPYNEQVQAGKTGHEQVKALRALHEKAGIGTLSGARAYLSLMMQRIVAWAPLDEKYWTVLNAEVVAKDAKALLGYGGWQSNLVRLYYGRAGDRGDSLRLRGAVRV